MARLVCLSAALALIAIAGDIGDARGDDPTGRDIPAGFSSLEFLLGKWNGQAMPRDNSAERFRGWSETHTWAWTFTKGKPTGLSLTIAGGKVLASGRLTYGPAKARYRLEGTKPTPGGPIVFEGALDASGKALVLDQVGGGPAAGQRGGTVRLSVRPNSNFIRYTMLVDRKEPGAVQFSHATEVGLTKEGESLAGGASSGERPRCIVTGGAATMSLTYQGQTFQICCTGCRDEFNADPEKYIKKARMLAQSQGAKSKTGQPAPARVSRFEDAFSADVADAPAMKKNATATGAKPVKPSPDANSDSDGPKPAVASKGASKKVAEKPAATAARAAALLRIGQNLEKLGKTDAAIGYYQRIAKDYPDAPAAKTAKQRIKIIENP